MNTFSGKLVLITGGSSGLGLAVSKKLAALGANVIILARDTNKLEAARQVIEASRLSPQQTVKTIQGDVTDAVHITPLLQNLMETEGVPDLLINSAGACRQGEFIDQDVDLIHWTMDVNYFSVIHVTRAILPGMIRRKSGHIVNVSSQVGFFGMYAYSAYAAAKFAIRGFSDSLRTELKPYGVNLSIIFPPDIDTPGFATEREIRPPVLVAIEDGNELMSADAVADSLLKGVARNRYVILPGWSGPLYYALVGLLGWGLVYPIVDMIVADGRSKVARNQAKYTHQHVANPDQGGNQKVN